MSAIKVTPAKAETKKKKKELPPAPTAASSRSQRTVFKSTKYSGEDDATEEQMAAMDKDFVAHGMGVDKDAGAMDEKDDDGDWDPPGTTRLEGSGFTAATQRWAKAQVANSKICPLCKTTDMSKKITIGFVNPRQRRGYDIDHRDPPWVDREAALEKYSASKADVSAAYNTRLRVTCNKCNVSHKHEKRWTMSQLQLTTLINEKLA
jgi:hypothetical protein